MLGGCSKYVAELVKDGLEGLESNASVWQFLSSPSGEAVNFEPTWASTKAKLYRCRANRMEKLKTALRIPFIMLLDFDMWPSDWPRNC